MDGSKNYAVLTALRQHADPVFRDIEIKSRRAALFSKDTPKEAIEELLSHTDPATYATWKAAAAAETTIEESSSGSESESESEKDQSDDEDEE